MKRNAAFVLCVAVGCVFLAFSSTSVCEEKIRWVSINAKHFDLEQDLGALSSCAYRLVEPGKSVEFLHESKIRVVVAKGEDSELAITVYVNKKAVKKLDKKLAHEAMETVIQKCYERIAGVNEE